MPSNYNTKIGKAVIMKAVLKWQKKNPEKRKLIRRKCHLKSKFGLTIEKYEEILKSQNYRCYICNIHQNKFSRRLAVDHCHKTKVIRGLLCINCNKALGLLNDNISLLYKCIEYLKKESHDI